MEMNQKLLAKAMCAESIEDLMRIAKENDVELSEENAKAYFELLCPKNGELSDDELDNVAGGGCHKDGRLVTTLFNSCGYWRCKKKDTQCAAMPDSTCPRCTTGKHCETCCYCSYEKGLWLCNNVNNRG